MKRIHEKMKRPDKERKTRDIFRTLKTPLIKARIQATNTALFIFSSVIMFGYCIVNLMARSLSRVTNIRWKYEAITITIVVVAKQISTVPLSLRPNNRKIFHRTNNGWPRRPVKASVTAKQASKTLLLVRSRGVDFTAFITNTLSRTVKGQVMVLMMITIIAPATEGTSAVSPSLLVVFVIFVELAEEKFTMMNWKLNPSKLSFS